MIFGAAPRDGGQILVDGREVDIRCPEDALRCGIGFVPEDRKLHGLVLGMDVKENVTLAILRQISNSLAIVRAQKQKQIAEEFVQALDIATPSLSQLVKNLSGGTQQKVVVAKWLCAQPRVLIMDEPTRGIDVGAKAEVHALMSRLAKQGIGILMISSEMPELIGMSDRVIVMCQGRVTGEFQREELTQENIMACATQFLSVGSATGLNNHTVVGVS